MTFPIDHVRNLYPALSLTDGGRPRIYVDNPAGTQVPASVAEAVSRCLIESNANLGGAFVTSLASERVVDDAHRAMADFLGTADIGEVVIGANMTSLTLHLSRSLCRIFEPGDEIIVTTMDHEGNIAPWLAAAEDNGLTVKWLTFSRDSWQIESETLEQAITDRTRLVALNYASNLTGSINRVKEMVRTCRQAGVLTYVDAVQYAPHGTVDVVDLDCDFLVCSAYKFFGPHLGIAWGRRALLEDLTAYKCRCASDSLPEKWETGTPQIELLAGLTATVDHFADLGRTLGEEGGRRAQILEAFEASKAHEDGLAAELIDGLRALPGVTIHGITEANRLSERVPTVSVTHQTVSSESIAKALAAKGVFVWHGHNYAYEIVKALGLSETDGVVRIGLAHYNTQDEVNQILEAVGQAIGA